MTLTHSNYRRGTLEESVDSFLSYRLVCFSALFAGASFSVVREKKRKTLRRSLWTDDGRSYINGNQDPRNDVVIILAQKGLFSSFIIQCPVSILFFL